VTVSVQDYRFTPAYSSTIQRIEGVTAGFFPGLVVLPNKTLFATYMYGGELWSRISKNEGITWSDTSFVDIGTPLDANLGYLPNGKLLLPFMLSTSTDTVYSRIGTISGDNISWGARNSIKTQFKGYAVAGSRPIPLANGNTLLPVYGKDSTDPGFDLYSAVLISTDNGVTWPTQVTTGPKGTTYGFNEQSGVQLWDGTVVMIMRHSLNDTLNDKPGSYYRSQSTNSGTSWSTPVEVLSDTYVGNPSLISLGGDTLFLTIRFTSSQNRYYTTSVDRGVTWTTPKPFGLDLTVDAGNSSVLLPSGRVGNLHVAAFAAPSNGFSATGNALMFQGFARLAPASDSLARVVDFIGQTTTQTFKGVTAFDTLSASAYKFKKNPSFVQMLTGENTGVRFSSFALFRPYPTGSIKMDLQTGGYWTMVADDTLGTNSGTANMLTLYNNSTAATAGFGIDKGFYAFGRSYFSQKIRVTDTGGGDGVIIRGTPSSSFAGVALQDSANSLHTNLYWNGPDNSFRIYHNGLDRMTVSSAGDVTMGGNITAGNSVTLTWGWGAFAASTRVAIYLPGTTTSDKFLLSWQPVSDTTRVGSLRLWAYSKTDSLVVRTDSTCSTQFTYMRPK
jgi:hypothetical protein